MSKPLSIVHINECIGSGGAAKVAVRLMNAQRARGHRALMLVARRTLQDPFSRDFDPQPDLRLQSYCQAYGQLFYEYQGSHRLDLMPEVQAADVVHLHNLHERYFNPYSLLLLSRQKPVVWTLHDMQSFTGHCAHSYTCEKWRTGCGGCPDLNIYPALPIDTTAQLWKDKRWIYEEAGFHVVTPSAWLAKKAEAGILGGHGIEVICNGVDAGIFKPYPKDEVRRRARLPENSLLVGCVASGGVLANPWKGGEYMLAAMKALRERMPGALFLNIGAGEPSAPEGIINIPNIADESTLAALLSALDIFLFTSTAENCPLSVLETLSCGIPVVTFATGGTPELVRDGVDGRVVEYKNVAALSEALIQLAHDSESRRRFGANAREGAVARFDQQMLAGRYEEVYSRIIADAAKKTGQKRRLPLKKIPAVIKTPAFLDAVKRLQDGEAAVLDGGLCADEWMGVYAKVESLRETGRFDKALQAAEKMAAKHPEEPGLALMSSRLKECLDKSSEEQGRYRVSAIVSVYNSERFIEGCLKDLTDQTLYADGRMEIVLVNSASPQNEHAYIENFRKNHPHIQYVRTEQRETLYQAWNRGIRMAQGRYVTNANTDDRHRKDALEIMARTLDQNPEVALVYGDLLITYYEGQTFDHHICCGYSLRPDYQPEIMLSGCHMGPQPMWRRSLHEEIGWFCDDLKSAGDYEFWCRIALKHPLKHIPQFLGLYLENQSGIVNADHSLSDRETAWVKDAYRGKFPPPSRDFIANHQFSGRSRPTQYVNICMVTYNRLAFTREAIAALVAHTAYPHVLTVVDNGSQDETPDFLRQMKAQGIIKNLLLLKENVGVARAANLGWLQEPEADYYLKFDNDIVIKKCGWLEAMVEVVEAIPEAGMVGYSFEQRSYPKGKLHGCEVRPKDGTLGGACVIIPKRTWQKLGYWCEDYGLYGEEDCDYGFRAANAGLMNFYMEDEQIGTHLPGGRAAVLEEGTFEVKEGVELVQEEKYRRWKDSERLKARKKGGVFENNIRRYCLDRGRLFCETRWRKENSTNENGGWQWSPPLPPKQEKVILLVAFVAQTADGCGFYRMALPAAHIMEASPDVCVRVASGIDFHVTTAADVILVQRELSGSFYERMCNWQADGKKVGFELDDNFDELPPTNYNYHLLALKGNLHAILRQADFCVFSTELLKKYYQQKLSLPPERCHVVANYVDLRAFQAARPESARQNVRIGYAGTVTHTEDFRACCLPALKAIAKRHGNRAVFVMLGWTPDLVAHTGLADVMQVEIHGEVPIRQYAQKLMDLDLDIALAPLEDNEFNRCKSNIKLLEYGAAGVAVVASDVTPYRFIESGVHGLLAREPGEWEGHLDQLVQDGGLRKKLGGNLNTLVREQYEISAHVGKWVKLFQGVMARQG
ncbi:MAG: glycosyltransferase [Verrucomicrobiae bacterium]|nr:glycosyltransferase [Verrucomicrobiae bacterium]